MEIKLKNVNAAKKVVCDWFPGGSNVVLRSQLREQLDEQLELLESQDQPQDQVYLGKGIFFLRGKGDPYIQRFNEAINNTLFHD